MGAGLAMLSFMQQLYNFLHFFKGEGIMGLYCCFAGHHGKQLFSHLGMPVDRGYLGVFGKPPEQVGDQLFEVIIFQVYRRFGYCYGLGACLLDYYAARGKLCCMGEQQLLVCWLQVNKLGKQESYAGYFVRSAGKLLEKHGLMRCVLVYENYALWGLYDDVGLECLANNNPRSGVMSLMYDGCLLLEWLRQKV